MHIQSPQNFRLIAHIRSCQTRFNIIVMPDFPEWLKESHGCWEKKGLREEFLMEQCLIIT
jgi:hypothetical protein